MFVEIATPSAIWAILGASFAFAFLVAWRSLRVHVPLPRDRRSWTPNGIAIDKTQILRCGISHFRLFPKRHRFSYPYLSVGIPVRVPESTWLLSVDAAGWWNRGWLQVSAEDHLNRDKGDMNMPTLSGKVDAYLRSQGLNPEHFPHIYLFTSPRFLNYSFKPASFWYLYTKQKELKYVIAEVNNTFSERRMYLFPAPECSTAFSQTLEKDFHVSPFSSRKGSYTLTTTTPTLESTLSIRVTLRSSRGHPKLVARWWSIAPALDPSTLSTCASIWLLVFHGSALLTTFLKIVFQATILAQIRGLQIWYRPEPRETAIGRPPSAVEAFLGSVFFEQLQHLLERVPGKCIVKTKTSEHDGNPNTNQNTLWHLSIINTEIHEELHLRIHTPQFLRQLITHRKLSEFLAHTLLDPCHENRTAWSDDPQSLLRTIEAMELAAAKQKPRSFNYENVLDLVWLISQRIHRTAPLKGSYPDPGNPYLRENRAHSSSPTTWKTDECSNVCFLDDLVWHNCSSAYQLRYLAARLYLGWRLRIMQVIGGE